MSLKAYVRYDNTERIVPGGPIVTSVKPKVGNWIAVDDVLVTTTASNYKLRGFIRYLKNGNYVAGSLILQKDKPKDGNWKEVYVINPACCGAATTYYNVAGCERMEYHVIAYTGVGVLAEGTIVNNATPECWFIIDQATGPEDVGTITYVWDTPSDCQPCINSHITTTTTTTSAPFYSFILNTVPRYIEFGQTGCDACNGYSGGPFVTMYSNVSTLTTGSVIYNDPGLTSPFSGAGTDAWYAIDNNGNISYTQIGRVADGNTGLIFNGPVSCSTCTPTTTTTTSTSTSTTTTTTTAFPTVTIGTQVWMGENLDVTTYRNGDVIPEVTDPAAWAALTTGAWCYLNNDPANGPIYGKLYNWYAVNDPRGLGPVGYHVPTLTEYTTLSDYLGGDLVAGGALKEAGDAHWIPNTGATNSSGWTGLPGYTRLSDGTFGALVLNTFGYWWTSSENSPGNSNYVWLYKVNTVLYGVPPNYPAGIYLNPKYGFSVRCLQN